MKKIKFGKMKYEFLRMKTNIIYDNERIKVSALIIQNHVHVGLTINNSVKSKMNIEELQNLHAVQRIFGV